MNLWNSSDYTIDFIEKIAKPNIEKQKNNCLMLSIFFFSIAISYLLAFLIRLFFKNTYFLMGIRGIFLFLFFLLSIYFFNVYKKINILVKIVNDIKKNNKVNINQLSVSYKLPYNLLMCFVMFATSNDLLKHYEIVGNDVVRKIFHLSEKKHSIQFIKCPNCGANISTKDKQCVYCGTKLC